MCAELVISVWAMGLGAARLGKVVLGGGYDVEQAGVNEVRESRPETAPGIEGWRIGLGADDDVDVHGTVYAICADE